MEHQIWFLSFLFCMLWVYYPDFLEQFVKIGVNFIPNDDDKSVDSLKEKNEQNAVETNTDKKAALPVIVKYEDKYLDLFNKCPSEYVYTDLDFQYREQNRKELQNEYETNFKTAQEEIKQKCGNLHVQYCKLLVDDIEDIHVDDLISMHDINIEPLGDDCDGGDDGDTEIIEQFKKNLIEKCKQRLEEYAEELDKLKREYAQDVSNENIERLSYENMIKNRQNRLIDNYIMEFCPLGNVIMRYNSDKMSFEYFSNKSIPFRFLETIARKYVATYLCRPLYVCLEKKTENSAPKFTYSITQNDQQIHGGHLPGDRPPYYPTTPLIYPAARAHYPPKGGNGQVPPPPPQMMNKRQINTKPIQEKQTNRYTWAGSLNNFSILKPIDRKIVDKKYAMSYKEYKKLETNTNR